MSAEPPFGMKDVMGEWQGLQGMDVADLAAMLMQRSAAERYAIHQSLYEAAQARVGRLERQLAFWEPLGRRYLQLRSLLGEPLPPLE